MQVKPIENEDMLQLCALTVRMYKEINSDINEFGAINTLMHEINTAHDFIAIGLYKDTELVGFVKGYCFSKNMFHFSGIYVIMKNNKWLKQLIEYCFALVEKKGYSAWSVDATNGNISSIMEKYGAKVTYTRYVKEIVNG